MPDAATGSRPQTTYTRKRICLETVALLTLQRKGFPRPQAPAPTPDNPDKTLGYLMLPKGFSTILACEPVTVAQVILEVLEQTIGYVGDNAYRRREWAQLPYRHFERKGLMGRDAARSALAHAVKAGYLCARPVKRPGRYGSWEYAIRWQDLEYVPSEGGG
jgi:hypothetical protein